VVSTTNIADPCTEDDLLRAARAGDRTALEQLLLRHEPQVYRFALRMCDGREDARDVLQETLIAAYKGLPQFRGDAKLSTWLFQIARSFCTKSRRTRVGQPRVFEGLDTPEARGASSSLPGPEQRTHAREVGDVLRAALASLPADHREVLVLKDVEGLTVDEVASVVGDSVPAIKSRLHRARLELKRLLDHVLGEGVATSNPCPQFAEELAGYAAGDIHRAACEQMEAHMARCPRCTAACERLKATLSMCSSVAGDDVPAPIQAAIRQALSATSCA
jgi:RNA polymerase sigma-70 factor (ECF subfamily)